MIIVPDAGERELLRVALEAALASDIVLSLRLFKNDFTPGDSTALADFTESDFTGYFRRDLARADWQDPSTVSGKATAIHGTAALEWTNTGSAQTVYGYFIIDPATAVVWWCERFTPPRTLATNGKLQLQPAFTLRSEA